jgi:8-oxo-dGTP diphosphatase
MSTDHQKFYLAVYAVFKKDDQILLLKRHNTGFEDGNYSMVAGHMDGNETVKDSLKREVKEEVGIALDLKNVDIAHIMHRKTPDREYIDFYLSVSKWNGEVKNMEPEKCSELRWVKINKLPGNTIQYIQFAIDQINRKEIYSEYGFD